MLNEDFAIVIDYMAYGRSSTGRKEPLVQLIGINHFTLLEAKPKEGIKLLEKVYIGKEKREKIEVIKRRINYKMLTANAISELETAIEKIIDENKQKYLDFYNNARPISLRLHQIELLPNIGKKHLKNFLDEREKKPFKSFKEIKERIALMPDPKKSLIKRIIEELEGNCKHYLFVRPPSIQKPRGQSFYGFKYRTKQFNG